MNNFAGDGACTINGVWLEDERITDAVVLAGQAAAARLVGAEGEGFRYLTRNLAHPALSRLTGWYEAQSAQATTWPQ